LKSIFLRINKLLTYPLEGIWIGGIGNKKKNLH